MNQQEGETTTAEQQRSMDDFTGGESEADMDSQSESKTPTKSLEASFTAEIQAESQQGNVLCVP